MKYLLRQPPLFVVLHGGRSCCATLCSFCAESQPWFAGPLYEVGNGAACTASQGLTPDVRLPWPRWLWAPASVHCSHTQKPCPTKDVLSEDAACRRTLLRGEGSSPVAMEELGSQPGARVSLTGSCNLNRQAKHFGHIPMQWVARRKELVLGVVPRVGIQNLFCCSLAL